MNIVVCIKQVPDVDDIKWTKENNLDRASMLSKMNLCDEWALDYAVKIKKQFSEVTVTALSMGPKNAEDILSYALAKGADRAVLLSDVTFSGSDTLATSKIISSAIKKIIPDFDLIITGQYAQDGDTAQVPVSVSQMLGIVDITNVVELYNADKNNVLVAQKLNNDINVCEASTPCLIAVKKECPETYIPRIDDYIRAQNVNIETYNATDLLLQKDEIGIIGSPTMVYKAFKPEIEKNTVEIQSDYTQTLLDFILKVK